MKNWLILPPERRREIFIQTAGKLGLPAEAVEKDWWVCAVLEALFSLPIAQHLVFKGGTSLSKGWKIIDRFSEDIDVAMNRELLGYRGELSNTQIKKLKKEACQYISTDFREMLRKSLHALGLSDEYFEIEADEIDPKNPDHDPQRLLISYTSVVSREGYIKDKVVVEVGSRSESEPAETRNIQAMVYEIFPEASFYRNAFKVLCISPIRTFLEKAFLLHEEFTRPADKRRHERMSRHLYDLERIMDSEHGISGMEDEDLYKRIVAHRMKFTPVKDADYERMKSGELQILPQTELKALWETDYGKMRSAMFYGESLTYEDLATRIQELQNRFHRKFSKNNE